MRYLLLPQDKSHVRKVTKLDWIWQLPDKYCLGTAYRRARFSVHTEPNQGFIFPNWITLDSLFLPLCIAGFSISSPQYEKDQSNILNLLNWTWAICQMLPNFPHCLESIRVYLALQRLIKDAAPRLKYFLVVNITKENPTLLLGPTDPTVRIGRYWGMWRLQGKAGDRRWEGWMGIFPDTASHSQSNNYYILPGNKTIQQTHQKLWKCLHCSTCFKNIKIPIRVENTNIVSAVPRLPC